MRTLDTTYINANHKSDYEFDLDTRINHKTLSVKRVDSGVVLPCRHKSENSFFYEGGVLDEKGEFISESGWYQNNESSYPMGNGYKPDKIVENDEEVIYCGIYFEHYGHFLLESTTRLWYYLSLSEDEQKRYKLLFLLHSSKPGIKNIERFLELLHINDKIIWLTEATRFKTVIVPEESSRLGLWATKEFMLPFKKIAEKIKPATYRKIYFSRTQFNRNANTIGEEKIERLFVKNGFKAIYPEQLDLEEQISLVKGAKQIAMLNGSACHNTVFAEPGLEAIILNRFSAVNLAQFLCDSITGIHTTYIDAFETFLPVAHGMGPFLVCVTGNLMAYIRDHKMRYRGRIGITLKELHEFMKRWSEVYSVPSNFAWIKTLTYWEETPKILAQFIKEQEFSSKQSLFYRLTHKKASDYKDCSDIDVLKNSRLFNKWWYLRHYWLDVLKSKLSAEEHYLNVGFKEGKNPSRKFDNDYYLNTYADIKASGINPLIHYERFGCKEGRDKRKVKNKESKRGINHET